MSNGSKVFAAAAVAAGALGVVLFLMRETDQGLARGPAVAATAGTSVPAAVASSVDTMSPSAAGAEASTLPPRQGTATSAFMPELRRAADAGDASAACKLAFELSGCLEVQRLEVNELAGQGLNDNPDQPLSTVAAHHGRCSGATEADLRDRYRYQAQAFESGDPAIERSFVQMPLLHEDDFLANTPNAVDFRRRGQAYVARALKRRDVEDLKVLLQVYMPSGSGHSMSRLRMTDDAMFVALTDAALQAGAAEPRMQAIAAQLRRRAGADLHARVAQRASQVDGPWRKVAAAPAVVGEPGDGPCGALERG